MFRTRKVPTEIFGNVRYVRYCVLKPIVRRSAGAPGDRYMEEKQTELENENK